jgi:hypothetical protein
MARRFWTQEMNDNWRPAEKGDIVYLIGSFGQRVGPPAIVMIRHHGVAGPGSEGTVTIRWPNQPLPHTIVVEDLEVVND